MGIKEIYLPYDLYKVGLDSDAVCVLPEIPKEGEIYDIPKGTRVMVNNLGQINMAKGAELLGGHRLNVFNSKAAEMLSEMGLKMFTVSPELNQKEIKSLRQSTDLPIEIIAYGRLQLMLMENCVIKSAYRCACDKANFSLKDRKNVEFPVISQNCRNIILNSCPVYMADRIDDIKNLQIDSAFFM